MKRKFLRNVSIVIGLALCFCVGSWAMVSADDEYVAKVNDTPCKTLAEAFNAANHLDNNPTVTILKDVKDVAKPFSLYKSMTIDLNGKVITTDTKSDLSRVFWIGGKATVNITDSRGGGSLNLNSDLDADIYTILMDRATLNLEKGIISCYNDRRDNKARSSVIGMGSQGAVVNLKGATLSSKGGVISFGIVTGGAKDKENVPTLNFTSGKIEIDNGQLAWGIYGNGNVNVTGGEMTVNGNSQVYLFYFTTGSDYMGVKNISGGTFTATGVSSATGILNGPVTVTGGKFKVTTTGEKSTPYMLSDTGSFDIRGGYYNLPFDKTTIPDGYRVKELTSGAAYNDGYRYEVIPRKFHLDVTGYDYDDATKEIPVNADVYSDYSFKVSLPDPLNDNLTAAKATVNIAMTGVESLGLKAGETRNYSKTLETGVTNVKAPLHNFLKNTYKFNGVTCPVTIKDSKDNKTFTYNIAGINEDYAIVGTPSSTEDARAAWELLTSHVKASQDLSTNDTHFLFKKGAYLQFGDEKLVFDTDFDFLKGAASLDDLFNNIRPAVHVEKTGAPVDSIKSASIYLPAGSTLGVSSSAATVDQNVMVTMDGSRSTADESNFKGLLSGYRDRVYSNGTANKTVAIALLVVYFDQVIGAVDAAEEVPFTVEFTPVKTDVQYIDWNATDKTAWQYMTPDDDNTYNIDGDNLYAFKVTKDVENVNVKFTRNFAKANTWYPWFVPFDVNVSDYSDKYEFAKFETITGQGEDYDANQIVGATITIIKKKEGEVIYANQPYFIRLKNDSEVGENIFNCENITLKATDNVEPLTISGGSYNYVLTGLYTTKTASSTDNGWYYITTNGTFNRASGQRSITIKPFRIYLRVEDKGAKYAKPQLVDIVLEDETTGITGIKNDPTQERLKAYDLQGRRVSHPIHGIYIVNGHKVIVK